MEKLNWPKEDMAAVVKITNKIDEIVDVLSEFNKRLENLEQIVYEFTGHIKP